uniref:Uncharacterized protein n=1 Tax=uncultured Thiotrichaceae bacterium TaxID=298394 RepID=A0A6S6U033_9GAMM|nr:MAG: Unknown protein [uncultured Thiotrichaceae bacterium]
MYINPPGMHEPVVKAGLAGVERKADVGERDHRRYQYLFNSSPLHSNKSLYRHVVSMVNQFISQIMGREGTTQQMTVDMGDQFVKVRKVRGIADRMPRLVDPDNPKPQNDSVFLGEAKDYPTPVLAIEYNNMTKPVFYEGNQVVARHLHLDRNAGEISGNLVLNDGSRLPIDIMILTAV